MKAAAMNLVAIDPGVHHCGMAGFEGVTKKLAWATLVRAPDLPLGVEAWTAMAEEIVTTINFGGADVVIEFPRVYQGGKKQGADMDLLELAATVGAIATAVSLRGAYIRRVIPSDWKGQMDKSTSTARVLERLSPEEKSCIAACPASLLHNVHDAIGIGLWAVGRFEMKRVYAR